MRKDVYKRQQEAHQHHCQGGVVFRLLLLSFLEKGAGFFQHFRNVACLLYTSTEGGYKLDMSRDGYVGVNFNTPEPSAAALGLFGFSLSMLRRRRTAA